MIFGVRMGRGGCQKVTSLVRSWHDLTDSTRHEKVRLTKVSRTNTNT
jgi:hypothetical protein